MPDVGRVADGLEKHYFDSQPRRSPRTRSTPWSAPSCLDAPLEALILRPYSFEIELFELEDSSVCRVIAQFNNQLTAGT